MLVKSLAYLGRFRLRWPYSGHLRSCCFFLSFSQELLITIWCMVGGRWLFLEGAKVLVDSCQGFFFFSCGISFPRCCCCFSGSRRVDLDKPASLDVCPTCVSLEEDCAKSETDRCATAAWIGFLNGFPCRVSRPCTDPCRFRLYLPIYPLDRDQKIPSTASLFQQRHINLKTMFLIYLVFINIIFPLQIKPLLRSSGIR